MYERLKAIYENLYVRWAAVIAAVVLVIVLLWWYSTKPGVIEDALKVEAPSRVEIGELVTFKVLGASRPAIRVLAAKPGPDEPAVLGGITSPVMKLPDADSYMLTVTRQGVYVIEAFAAAGYSIRAGRAVVTIGEPGPDPTPTPDVVITPGKRTIALIRETSNSNPELAGLAVKLRTNNQIEAKGHQVYILDKDMLPTASRVNAKIAAINQKLQSESSLLNQLPLLFILDQDSSNVYFAGPCPKDEQGVLSLIKRYGG